MAKLQERIVDFLNPIAITKNVQEGFMGGEAEEYTCSLTVKVSGGDFDGEVEFKATIESDKKNIKKDAQQTMIDMTKDLPSLVKKAAGKTSYKY